MTKLALHTSKFLDRLLIDFRGQIIFCNILDGLNEKLYNTQLIRDFFDWWLALYLNQKGSSVNAMLATMETLVFENVPKGFRPGTPKPNFRLICCRQPRLNNTESELTTVIPVFVFKDIISRADQNRLISQGIEFPSDKRQPWSNEALKALMELPDVHRSIRLEAGRTIGRQHRLVWFTRRTDMDKVLSGCMNYADQTRDSLGLVHHESDEILIALHFSGKALKYVNSGRPAFSDAGTHRRFKTRADIASNRKRSAWGYTTDLRHFAAGRRYVDGLPERVADPIDEKALAEEPKISFTPLGKVTISRGNTKDDNDERFANRLLNGRDRSSIKKEILSIL